MNHAYICDAVRTPIGRYGGALASVRTDDLAAIPLKALLERNPKLDPAAIEEVLYGCANGAGEDNRNVARMALLLAGLPQEVAGATINRLCGSGMDAVGTAARAIMTGQIDLAIAGGVESMSRAPFVMPKAESPFSRANAVYDTTIGWRFVNPKMKAAYGVDRCPRPPRTWRPTTRSRARTRTPSRCAARCAPPPRRRAASSRARSCR